MDCLSYHRQRSLLIHKKEEKREKSCINQCDHCLSWLQLLMVGLKSHFFLLKYTGCNKHAQPVDTKLFSDVLEWGKHTLIPEQFHVAAYPKFILSVNFNYLVDKLFYWIQISLFSCLKQGSFLLNLKCSCKWVIQVNIDLLVCTKCAPNTSEGFRVIL